MKNQNQTEMEKSEVGKVELFDFLMTLRSLINSMTTLLLSTATDADEGGGDDDAADDALGISSKP